MRSRVDTLEEEEADKEEVDKKGKEEDKEEQKKEDREDKAEQGDHLEAGQPDESDEGDAEAHAHEVHEGPVAGEHPHTDNLVVRKEKWTTNTKLNKMLETMIRMHLTPMETVTERSSARVNLPQSPSEIFPFVVEHGCTRYWGGGEIIIKTVPQIT